MPRPVSRAYEAVGYAFHRSEVLPRVRWCAEVALHFVAAVRLAASLAHGGGPVSAPGRHDLRRHVPGSLAERSGRAVPRALRQFAGDYGGEVPEDPRAALARALAAIPALADLRVAVPEAGGLTVLLGPRMEYRLPLGDPPVPPGTPLLVDPADGRFLALAPVFAWERAPGSGFGRLLVLDRVEGDLGRYVEDGEPGSPGRSLPLAGRPQEGTLALPPALRPWLRSPPARLSDGEVVAGLWEVLGLTWRGGTSDVFMALRQDDGRRVALKTFEYELGVLDENFRRFVDEERLSEGIHHPRIVRPVSVPFGRTGLAHEQPWVGGGSLADLMEVDGVLAAPRAVALADQVLEALEAVHAAGIVHNDVKPDNVLFDVEGGARLIDFGIACRAAPARGTLRPGAPVGSPGYVAPEVREGAWPSAASDLFSVGVLLVQMLAGELPRDADHARQVRGVPRALHPFLARCLAPRPEVRFASAAEARADLARRVRGLAPARAVALDLEGTLITAFPECHARPGLRAFLFSCMDRFDRIFVYTLLTREQAAETLEALALAGHVPLAFLHRYEYVDWPRGRDGSTKDLRRCRVPVALNAIVDDSEEVVPPDQRHRWVRVPAYEERERLDRALPAALVALDHLFGSP